MMSSIHLQKSPAGQSHYHESAVAQVAGHAVYIDAKEFLAHIPVDQYPGQALVGALFLHGQLGLGDR